jgi:hypothetical protein
VSGINIPGRTVSLTDYEKELRNKLINLYTQSDIDYGVNRIGYQWTAGTPEEDSHAIQLNVLLGDAVLGDFRLAALGIPEVVKPETKIVSNILVKKKTTLYIGESFNGYKYIMPELYLGIIIGNNKTPADCTVQGKLIVDGPNSKITVDRGATIHIDAGGELYLKNGSIMRSGYNEHFPIIFIDGTLIIDDLSQIATFNMDNFEFGENGKVVILNPDTGKKKLLFTTPNGIHNSELYRLFEKHTNHLEFHLSKNTGIGIDTYYKFYARDMKDWIGGLRIEKAIKEGIIVWHDGAFIELYSNVTPWVSANSTLLEASRIFKTIGSYDPEKLQDAVNRLNYAGCGNILFRFIYPTGEHELLLTLDGINMKGILNNPLHNRYELSTDNTGSLYIRNRIKDSTIKQIINKASRVIDVPDTYKGVFNLP